MKRKHFELDSDDEEIIVKSYKRQRLNNSRVMDNIFKEIQIPFDVKCIIDDYLNIDISKEVFCMYCQKLHLDADCIECDCCDKIICEGCESKHWNKVVDFKENTIFTCCTKCQKSFKKCKICKSHYTTYRDHCDNIKCKLCKEYTCILCMPTRIEKLKIKEHNVHVGGGHYRKYNNTTRTEKIYCKDCFFNNINSFIDKFFSVVST